MNASHFCLGAATVFGIITLILGLIEFSNMRPEHKTGTKNIVILVAWCLAGLGILGMFGWLLLVLVQFSAPAAVVLALVGSSAYVYLYLCKLYMRMDKYIFDYPLRTRELLLRNGLTT
jgi:uncharacterized membrane protein